MAHPSNVVRDGKARFTVLSPTLLRLEYSAKGRFEDRSSFFAVGRHVAPQDFRAWQSGGRTQIETPRLRLSYLSGQGPFSSSNLEITVLPRPGALSGAPQVWRPGMVPKENLGGTLRTLDECFQPLDLGHGLLARDGWHLHDDSASVLFSEEAQPWAQPRPKGAIDWYFFGYGSDYAAALKDLTVVGGKIPLPPRYFLGSWYSRFWPYTSEEFLAISQEYRDQGFPLDVMVIDMDWHQDGWTGYTWNQKLIPDPARLLRDLRERGLKVTLNLHPHDGVGPQEGGYREFAKAMGLKPSKAPKPLPFDITDKKFAANYFKVLLNPNEKMGVDFWWMDWQQGQKTRIEGLDPLMWLNHLHFRDRSRASNPAFGGKDRAPRRGMNFSRWSGWGDHRYPVHFSGDTHSTWEVLEYLVPFTATAGNAGAAYWSHDIGGHFSGEGRLDPELFLRWIQFGAFSPVLRVHSSRDKDNDRRPWLYGQEFKDAARRAYGLRARLVPYLYGASRECFDSGLPLLRPMYLHYPLEPMAYKVPGQFLLGADLLVAPATRPGFGRRKVAHVPVWFPEGDWHHLFSHERFSGPCQALVALPLDGMAVFARGGAPIPMAASPQAPAAQVPGNSPLVVRLYPGPPATRAFYEDDGESIQYAQGAFRKTLLSTRRLEDGGLEFSAGPGLGGFLGASNLRPSLELEVPSTKERGLAAIKLEEGPLDKTATVTLRGGWDSPLAVLERQAWALVDKLRLAQDQLEPANPRHAQAGSLIQVMEAQMSALAGNEDLAGMRHSLDDMRARSEAFAFDLAGDPLKDAEDAFRVLAGVSLQAQALPLDAAGFTLEVELRHEPWMSGCGKLRWNAPGLEGGAPREMEFPLSKGCVSSLKLEVPLDFRRLAEVKGEVELELAWKGRAIVLRETFLWRASAVREWMVLGPLKDSLETPPIPPASAADLDPKAGWKSRRFDPVHIARGKREFYDYAGAFHCPGGSCQAAVILESDRATLASLDFRHEGRARLWINGREAYTPGARRFSAELKAGANLVYVQVSNLRRKGGGIHLGVSGDGAARLSFSAPVLGAELGSAQPMSVNR